MADYFTVTTSFIGALRDQEVTYVVGEVVPSSDPGLKKWPQHFAPLVIRGAVEQATAAPGEKRKISLRGRKAKAKPAPEPEPEPEPEPTPEPVGAPLTTDSFRPRPR